MKKSLLFSFMVAGLVMMSSCTKENVIVVGGDDSNAAQQIVLQVANTGDGLQTRAGRPLYSSEAKQSVENVKVIICNKVDNKVAYVDNIDSWNTVSTAYNTNGHGREKLLTLKNKLGAGSYVAYAFAYYTGSDYKEIESKIAGVNKEATFTPNTVLELKDGVKGEEIFAGSVEFDVTKGVGFKRPIVLNRQVAGTFGYFEAIPYIEGATKLQLVASTRNQGLVLGQFHNLDLTENGTGYSPYFVVNGANAATDKVIYEINLNDWFTSIEDKDKDGLIDTDSWHNAYESNGAKFKNGSVFGGTFLVPFAKTTEPTFVLKLVKDNGDAVQTWTIKLPETDKQTANNYTLYSWDGDKFAENTTAKDEVKIYNVVRNHLYGIGTKTKDGEVVPPENPDPDTPEPLKKKQELTLRVNDNWDIIHKLEIEED